MFTEDPGLVAEKLATGRGDVNADELLGIMDMISSQRLSPAEQAVLSTWADVVRGQAERRVLNSTSVQQDCMLAAKEVNKQFLNTTQKMAMPEKILDEDAKECEGYSFLEISGVLFWSVLAMIFGGLCLWKICKK